MLLAKNATWLRGAPAPNPRDNGIGRRSRLPPLFALELVFPVQIPDAAAGLLEPLATEAEF